MSKSVSKCRYWLFVFYPESAPDWLSIIESWQVPVIVSPLHDRDVECIDKDSGEITYKKPHYHGIIAFENPVPYDKIIGLVEELNIHYAVAPRGTLGAAECYLVHMFNKDKAQYNIEDCTLITGYVPRFDPTRKAQSDFTVIHDMIEELGIVNYADLCNEVLRNAPDYYGLILRYPVHWNNICRARQRLIKVYNADNGSYVKLEGYTKDRYRVGCYEG